MHNKKGSQIDIAVFDTVPHDGLLSKLKHYGIDDKIWLWICTEWTQAPIFKKGSKLQAVNYRPVSLICITCKLFEHILCKHILAHLEDHIILTDLQYGFRSGRSCETQLVTTFQDLAQMHNKKV